MAAPSNWRAILWFADVDPNLSAYTQLATSTIAGYTGSTSVSLYIQLHQADIILDSEVQVDVSGWQEANITGRRQWDLELYPYRYTDSATEPDLTDLEAILNLFATKAKSWVTIIGDTRTYPGSTANAIPVVLTGWSKSVNAASGTRGGSITLQQKGTQ